MRTTTQRRLVAERQRSDEGLPALRQPLHLVVRRCARLTALEPNELRIDLRYQNA
jgi:hypothetical protein